MATQPTYTTDYVKRIAFLNGQVLEDFHLNTMQRNFAEAMKLKTTRERYDMYLLVSPYNYYFVEPFVNSEDRHVTSTANLDQLSYSVNSGAWISNVLELPAITDEVSIVANFEDFPDDGATVNFFYRTAESNAWNPMPVDAPQYLTAPTKYIQVKAECLYTGVIRPQLFDFAVLVK